MMRPRFSADGRLLACAARGHQLQLWHVGASQAYRTLRHQGDGPSLTYDFAAIAPDSRLLAGYMSDGHIHFWDLATGQEVGELPGTYSELPLFRASPPALITSSHDAGQQRWPLRPKASDPAVFQLGPPEQLARIHAFCVDANRDGRVLVACARNAGHYLPYAGGWVFSADWPNAPLRLDAGKDIWGIAVSADGCLAATTEGPNGPAKVWDARDGRLLQELAGGDGRYPRFSPDGRWLAINGELGRIHSVGSWEVGLRFRGRAEFSPDSRLLAICDESVIQLIEVASGRELAQLEDPHLEQLGFHHLFSPDGTRLVTLSNGREGGIHVWDLRALRRSLQEMDLDWDAPAYPPAPPPATTPLRLKFVP
jgi:WD40 repeat protein